MNRKQRRMAKSTGQPAPQRPAIAALLDQAQQQHQAGRLAEAEPLYNQILALDSRHPDALHLLGVLHSQTGRCESALKLINAAIGINPNVPFFYNNLGAVYKAIGQLKEAQTLYERALALKPDYADAAKNLGNALKEQDKETEAQRWFERALAINPDYAEAHYFLASILIQQGKKDAALPHLQHCIRLDAADRFGARMMLAAMGGKNVPDQATAAHMQRVYAQRAATWDKSTLKVDSYRGHALIAEALQRLDSRPEKLDILDAGCGTGLVGPLVRARAKTLEGIDLSDAMLAHARHKQAYDRLHEGDLLTFMQARPQQYDVITSAATLIHFGDLGSVFRAAAAALRKDGLFLFTLFPHADEDTFSVAQVRGLIEGGCYTHGARYVERTAREAGFTVISITPELHEYDVNRKPVTGLVVALRQA